MTPDSPVQISCAGRSATPQRYRTKLVRAVFQELGSGVKDLLLGNAAGLAAAGACRDNQVRRPVKKGCLLYAALWQ